MRGMNRITALIMAIVFLAAGIFIIYLGAQNSKNQKIFTETTGEIVRIYRRDVGDRDYEYDVFVKYTAGGKEYESKLDTYKDSFREGQKIDIKYDPADPVTIIAAGSGQSLYLIIFGVAAILISLVMALRVLRGR